MIRWKWTKKVTEPYNQTIWIDVIELKKRWKDLENRNIVMRGYTDRIMKRLEND